MRQFLQRRCWADTDSVARRWLENLHHAESIHANMLERPEERLPSEGEVGGYALGFPCQPFSRLAGKTRRGFQDPRSAVFYGGLRTLMTLLPAWAVLENVRGILSHKIPLDQAFRTAGVFQKYWAILVPLCPQETLKEPHRRPRVYILLARKDRCLVGGTETAPGTRCDHVPRGRTLHGMPGCPRTSRP